MKERCIKNWKTSVIGLLLMALGAAVGVKHFEDLNLINAGFAGLLLLFGVGLILSKDTALGALNKLLSQAAEKAIK